MILRSTATLLLFLFATKTLLPAGESFLLTDGQSGEILTEFGEDIEERFSPCSTFKMILAYIGYETGTLIDETTPIYYYCDGYDDYLPEWKDRQTPFSWMKYSCVWYSIILSKNIGSEEIEKFLHAFSYGNCDLSGGIVEPDGKGYPFWINSTLKISIKEQVTCIERVLREELPLSKETLAHCKKILYKEEISEGWKLYGKTGWSGPNTPIPHTWFVGWIERDAQFYPFAYLRRGEGIDLNQRIPRAKELIENSIILQK